MKPISLVFQREPSTLTARWLGHASKRWHRVVALAGLVCAIGALALVAWFDWETRRELLDTQASIARLRDTSSNGDRLRETEQAKVALAALPTAQRLAMKKIVNQLNTPWSSLFNVLEQTMPQSIALLTIEPDALQSSIKLQLEAKSLDELLVYAGSLKNMDPFGDVLLTKHETNDQDSSKPLRLSIDLRLPASSKPLMDLVEVAP